MHSTIYIMPMVCILNSSISGHWIPKNNNGFDVEIGKRYFLIGFYGETLGQLNTNTCQILTSSNMPSVNGIATNWAFVIATTNKITYYSNYIDSTQVRCMSLDD